MENLFTQPKRALLKVIESIHYILYILILLTSVVYKIAHLKTEYSLNKSYKSLATYIRIYYMSMVYIL